jgi:hypothetical protein
MGSSFRARSPENILQEMIDCHHRYGIEAFDIEDDNFTFDLKRAKDLMAQIIKTFGEGRLELSAMNGVSFASLNSELVSLMKRAGFRTLNLSFVSADLSTKERMNRPQPITDFDHLLKEAEKVGINAIAYAILGMPGQTLEEMIDTLACLMEKRVLIGPSVYYPVPETPLFQRCQGDGILPPSHSQWRSSALPIETAEFSRLDMVTLLRLARAINFIKGKMDQGDLEEGTTLGEISQTLKDETRTKYDALNWQNLISMLIRERSFFSVKKTSESEYRIQKEKTSERVLDYFLTNGWDKPILRSRND